MIGPMYKDVCPCDKGHVYAQVFRAAFASRGAKPAAAIVRFSVGRRGPQRPSFIKYGPEALSLAGM